MCRATGHQAIYLMNQMLNAQVKASVIAEYQVYALRNELFSAAIRALQFAESEMP